MSTPILMQDANDNVFSSQVIGRFTIRIGFIRCEEGKLNANPCGVFPNSGRQAGMVWTNRRMSVVWGFFATVGPDLETGQGDAKLKAA